MEDNFAKLTNEIALQEDVQNYKLEIQSSTNKGDGYLGMIQFGKISGSNKSLDVVFKCRHPKPEFHPELTHKIYINEIGFYEIIAPTFEKFQREHRIPEPFNNSAKIYGSIKDVQKETLALENLRVDNYFLWDRKQLMNEAHLKCALKTFAKFQATSFAMQKLNPALYEEITRPLVPDVFNQVLLDMDFYAQISKSIRKSKAIFNEDSEKHFADKLEHIAANITQVMGNASKYNPHNVIVQGDCWCANAMYKYDDPSDKSAPSTMKLLDFQMTKLGSPALDISYFFYAAAPKSHFDRLEYFLKYYHNELTQHLAKFGLKAENVFSFEDLMEHWRHVATFGLILAIAVRKIMLVESQDAPDITEGAENFIDKLVMTPELQVLYDQQIRELVEHFVERKLI